MPESPQEMLKDLDALEAKRTDLYSKLKASLAIQELWPEAFSQGNRVFIGKGTVSTRIQGSHSKGFRLYINTLRLGEEKSFPLSEIPLELACRDHIKKALKAIVNERCGPSNAKKEAEALLKELWKRGE